MRPAHFRRCVALLACCGFSVTAPAQGLSPFAFEAGYTMQRDDNLFRLPDGANTQALLGRGSAAEQIDIRSLGLSFDKSWSLQNLRLNYRVVDYQYSNFGYLNFTAMNHDMAWRWSVTPRVTGTLGSSRHEVLSSFSDFQGYSNRNIRTDSRQTFQARAEIDGLWTLLGSLSATRRENQQPVLAGNDYSGVSTEAGVLYERKSLDSARFVVRQTDGRYLNRSLPSSGQFDERFAQQNYELALRWIPGGWSDLNVMLGYLDRRHPNYPQRDFSGTTGRAEAVFLPGGKTRLTLIYARELSDYLSSTSSYLVSDQRIVRLSWQADSRMALSLQHSNNAGSYNGAVVPVSTLREDKLRDSTLSASWQAHDRIAISASLQHIARRSNQTGLDYDSQMTSLSLQANF